MAGISFKKVLKSLINDGTDIRSMEKMLFYFSAGFIIFVLVSNFVLYCAFGLGWRMAPVKGSALLLTVFVVLFAGRSKAYGIGYTVLCFLLSIVILPVTFIRAGGFHSGAPLYMVMCFIMCGCHIDKTMRYLTSGVALAFFGMVCVLALNYPELVYNLPGEAVVPEIILAFYLAVVSVTVVVSLYLNTCKNGYDKNLRDYEQKTEMRMALLEAQVENIEDVKRQRHNMRHHNMIIKAYAERKDMKGLRRYLQEKQYSDEFYSKKLYCMNMTVNNVLTIYYKLAENRGILMRIRADVKSDIRMDEQEFTNMLSTVIENAINGADNSEKEDKFVDVDIRTKGRRMIIRCINTCSDALERSSDRYPGIPGNGLGDIDRVLEENGGILKYDVSDGKVDCCLIVDAFG